MRRRRPAGAGAQGVPAPGREGGRRTFLLAVACTLIAGCYHYVPSEPEGLPAGAPVRVHLEPPGSFELPGLTAHQVLQVDGEIITRDPDGLFLSATWLNAAGGRGFPGSGWTVRVEQESIRGFEARRVSWWRTGLAVGGLALATWIGFEALDASAGQGGRSGTGGRPH